MQTLRIKQRIQTRNWTNCWWLLTWVIRKSGEDWAKQTWLRSIKWVALMCTTGSRLPQSLRSVSLLFNQGGNITERSNPPERSRHALTSGLKMNCIWRSKSALVTISSLNHLDDFERKTSNQTTLKSLNLKSALRDDNREAMYRFQNRSKSIDKAMRKKLTKHYSTSDKSKTSYLLLFTLSPCWLKSYRGKVAEDCGN